MTTAKEIKTAITENGAALSAKGIATELKIDADSNELRNIEQTCWEMVDAKELDAIDRREEDMGLYFQERKGA